MGICEEYVWNVEHIKKNIVYVPPLPSSMSCSSVSQRTPTKQSGLRKVCNHPLTQYCPNFLITVSDTKYFLLGTIYLGVTYCNSRNLVPQDVLSLNKYTIYFSRLMYLPVLYSYLISNVRFLTSCSLLTGKFLSIEH